MAEFAFIVMKPGRTHIKGRLCMCHPTKTILAKVPMTSEQVAVTSARFDLCKVLSGSGFQPLS
jgi:hypothetical protein